VFELTIEDDGIGKLSFEVRKLFNVGRSGRDTTAVRKHLDELRKTGIPVSDEFPTFYPKTADRITTSNRLEVLPNAKTSGEVECVLLIDGDNIYVTVGSDHTDRELQKTNLEAAKEIYYNIFAPKVWRYEDVKGYWDDLIMRSWVEKDGQRQLYQEGKLAEIMEPEKLLMEVKSRVIGDLNGMVIFTGTFPTLSGELCYSPWFEMELIDEHAGKTIKHVYSVKPIPWFKG